MPQLQPHPAYSTMQACTARLGCGPSSISSRRGVLPLRLHAVRAARPGRTAPAVISQAYGNGGAPGVIKPVCVNARGVVVSCALGSRSPPPSVAVTQPSNSIGEAAGAPRKPARPGFRRAAGGEVAAAESTKIRSPRCAGGVRRAGDAVQEADGCQPWRDCCAHHPCRH